MNWLETFFNKLFALLPKTVFVYPYEKAVRVTCLGWYQRITDIDTGWYVIWPLIQYILAAQVKPRAIDIRSQSIVTKDKVDVVISGALIYKIYNARKSIFEVIDFDKSMTTIALGIIRGYASKHTFEELIDMDELTEQIRKELHEACTKWGIKIQGVEITDFGKTRNIRLLTNGNQEPTEFEE